MDIEGRDGIKRMREDRESWRATDSKQDIHIRFQEEEKKLMMALAETCSMTSHSGQTCQKTPPSQCTCNDPAQRERQNCEQTHLSCAIVIGWNTDPFTAKLSSTDPDTSSKSTAHHSTHQPPTRDSPSSYPTTVRCCLTVKRHAPFAPCYRIGKGRLAYLIILRQEKGIRKDTRERKNS